MSNNRACTRLHHKALLCIMSDRSSSFSVIQANLRDVLAVWRLEKAIFPKDAYPLFEILLLFLTPRIRNVKVMGTDNKLAAFMSVAKNFGGYPAWIITIGVAESYQRCGIGRQLMQWVEDEMNPERIRLTVRASNSPAITLYEQMGYQHIDRRRRYYNDGEDGLIMEKHRATNDMRDLLE